MVESIDRRVFGKAVLAGIVASGQAWAADEGSSLRQRIEGMLVGSLIGDAAGGPIEFRDPRELTHILPAARTWPPQTALTKEREREVASSFRLLSYKELRPHAEPYAQWTEQAEVGTVTDDSRHKMPMFDAFRSALAEDRVSITRSDLARAYVNFPKSERIQSRPGYRRLCQEGLHEYVKAARWELGDRGGEAAPPDRLWGGVPTNAGQMALLPLAGIHAGHPTAAYLAAYELGFMDNGPAKDINSAIVAGLAFAIGHPKATWAQTLNTMKRVDPFGYAKIPFVERPVTHWIEQADRLASNANKSPRKLYRLLEQEGEPRYYWDAHFVLLSVLAIAQLCDYNALCSMQLSLDFGHDTDSSAQLLGAFLGALHGPEIFPASMRQQVAVRLRADYGDDLPEWVRLTATLQERTYNE